MKSYDVYVAPLDTPFPESVCSSDGQEFVLPDGFVRVGTADKVGREMMTPIVEAELEGLGVVALPGWRGEAVRVLAHRISSIKLRSTDDGDGSYHEVHVVAEAEVIDLGRFVTFYGRWDAETTSCRSFIFGPGAKVYADRYFTTA